MRRLFEAKRIRVIDFGPPSRGWRKIIDVPTEPPDPGLDGADETAPEPPTSSPPPTEAEIDTEIARHISLPEKLREADRRTTAKRLGMRVRVFEALVKTASRPAEIGENPQKTAISE